MGGVISADKLALVQGSGGGKFEDQLRQFWSIMLTVQAHFFEVVDPRPRGDQVVAPVVRVEVYPEAALPLIVDEEAWTIIGCSASGMDQE